MEALMERYFATPDASLIPAFHLEVCPLHFSSYSHPQKLPKVSCLCKGKAIILKRFEANTHIHLVVHS